MSSCGDKRYPVLLIGQSSSLIYEANRGESMLVTSVVARMFATNCWVIAPGAGQECIIVDPGMPDISHEVRALIAEHGLKPVATLMTHGHLDHTFSVKPLADGYAIPSYIHTEDRDLLLRPQGAHGVEFLQTLNAMEFTEPNEVKNLRHGELIEILGMKITAIHSPGHTRGSVMFSINEEILLSGDVLFAGSIGRTDLPSGSHEAMQKTLKTRVLPLNDELRVLPGHGPETTIKFERKNNPYLKELRT